MAPPLESRTVRCPERVGQKREQISRFRADNGLATLILAAPQVEFEEPALRTSSLTSGVGLARLANIAVSQRLKMLRLLVGKQRHLLQ